MVRALIQSAVGVLLIAVLDWGRLRRATPATRWVTGLILALSAGLYVASATWPELERPAALLIMLLRPLDPTR
ncbi:MAG TPA: hypothetical protein VD902_16230 [Symbiobacteriaceae bacterium]|nr:hypothetical protein [Symbiobacteriaceae bacterium]